MELFTIEIVDVPIKNGDVPWLCLFTRGYSILMIKKYHEKSKKTQGKIGTFNSINPKHCPLSLWQSNMILLEDLPCTLMIFPFK